MIVLTYQVGKGCSRHIYLGIQFDFGGYPKEFPIYLRISIWQIWWHPKGIVEIFFISDNCWFYNYLKCFWDPKIFEISFFNIVITSYSIHYTKLYDFLWEPCWDWSWLGMCWPCSCSGKEQASFLFCWWPISTRTKMPDEAGSRRS